MKKKHYLCLGFIYLGIYINSGLNMKLLLLAQHSTVMNFTRDKL